MFLLLLKAASETVNTRKMMSKFSDSVDISIRFSSIMCRLWRCDLLLQNYQKSRTAAAVQ